MVDRNKGYLGCKPNPIIETMSFKDYVIGFCENQVDSRTVSCNVCGEDSLCTSATIDNGVVHGVFKCSKCHHKDYKRVDMVVLKDAFNVARKGRLLVV